MTNNLKFLVLCVLLGSNQAYAAPPSGAGSIQRDIEKLNNPNLAPVPPKNELDEIVPSPQNDVTVNVKSFQFLGAQLLPEATLQAEVQQYIGQTLDYNGLIQITKKISELYRANGWLAKVYLPPQDIQNGLVTIEINEAKLGEIHTEVDTKARLNPTFATTMLANAQQKGAPLNNKALERAMLLINDTPGFMAQATLSQGAATGETDVTLNLADRPLFNANVWVDNYGTRSLGKARLNGQASFNNISGWGDQLSVQTIVSDGLRYVQGDVDVPLGYAGTRLELRGTVSDYDVVSGPATTLKPKGDANTVRLGIRHPVLRSRYANLSFMASAEVFNSHDEVLGLEVSDDQYKVFTVGIKGDHSDSYGLGGTFWAGVGLTIGDLSLDNATDLAVDKLTMHSEGSYSKLNFYLGRQQILGEKLIAKALLSGQLADGNLGGFEKFTLGGPSGLGGFTVGEAAADQGWMLNLEGRYAVTPQFSASLLADAGGVCQFKNTWTGWDAGNPKLQNCYQLASVGFGLSYTHQLFDARLSYGRQITGNRGLDSNGNDSEGESRKHQVWLQLSSNF